MTTINSCHTKSNHSNKTDLAIKDSTNKYIPEWTDTSKLIKENTLLSYVVNAKTVKPNYANGIPFAKLDYNKIIAYDFLGSEEPYPSVIDKNEKFVPVIIGQQYLNQEQADKILSTLSKNSSYGESTAACFQPHFALVFFKDNQKVNQINVCLDCNYLISEINIPAENHKKVNKGTKDEYSIFGFTKSGKTAIINLCKELKFYYGKQANRKVE